MPTWRNLSGIYLALLANILEQTGREARRRSKASRAVSEGGITNRNFRARFGGRECVVRLPGKDTELLGSTARPSARRTRWRREPGSRPRSSATLERPALPGHRFVEGPTMEPGRAARAGGAGRGGRGWLRALHELRRAVRAASTPSAWSRPTPRRPASAAARSRPPTSAPTRAAARIEAALGAPTADRRPGPLPQRPPGRQLHRLAGRHPDRRLGVRGDGRSLLRPRQLRRQQRARPSRGGGVSRPPTWASRPGRRSSPRCG